MVGVVELLLSAGLTDWDIELSYWRGHLHAKVRRRCLRTDWVMVKGLIKKILRWIE